MRLLFSAILFSFSPLLVLSAGAATLHPQQSQAQARPDDSSGIAAGHLRLLSYNIKMLPRFIKREHHFPIRRAHLIPAYLLEDNADILVLQEAFDKKANRIFRNLLKARYPYIIGPVNQIPGFKINGGVMICSKYPMKQIGAIQYSVCEDFDCWARKGVLLVEINDGRHTFQVAGTHLNGGGSLAFKTTEFHEMGQLMKQNARQGVPQFCAGDYNISNFDTAYYRSMIKELEAQDGPVSGPIFFTNDHLNNDMERFSSERNLIDYILYRPNGVQPAATNRLIHSYCCQWSKDHDDLSDHYALLLDLNW